MTTRRWAPTVVAVAEVSPLAGVCVFTVFLSQEKVQAIWPLSWLGFLVVGAFLVNRMPGHAIPWAMLLIGALVTLAFIATEFRDVVADGVAPWAAWFGEWTFIAVLTLVALFPLWYPTGAPPSPRWLPLERAIAVAGGVLSAYYAVRPAELGALGNPIGIEGLRPLRESVVEGPASIVAEWQSTVTTTMKPSLVGGWVREGSAE